MKQLSLLKTMIVIAVIGLFLIIGPAQADTAKGNYFVNLGSSIAQGIASIPVNLTNFKYVADETNEHGMPGLTTAAANWASRIIVKPGQEFLGDGLLYRDEGGDVYDIGSANRFLEEGFVGDLKNGAIYVGATLATGGTGALALGTGTMGFVHTEVVNRNRNEGH